MNRRVLLISLLLLSFPYFLKGQYIDDIIKEQRLVVVSEAPPRIMDSVIAAYQGTWKYEDKESGIEFIVKIKCDSYEVMPLYIKHDQIHISGAYLLKKNGVLESNNFGVLDKIKEFSVVTDFNENLFYSAPLFGALSLIKNVPDVGCFIFEDQTTEKQCKYFYIRTDTMDSSNNHLYWDFSDRNLHPLLNEKSFLMTREEIERNKKIDAAGFSVPEKCILTRISHSVYE